MNDSLATAFEHGSMTASPGSPLRHRLTTIVLAFALTAAACTDAVIDPGPGGVVDLSQELATASPESQGVNPGKLSHAVSRAGDLANMRSLVVVRHGRIVQESYFGGRGRDDLNDVRSVTKTVVSMLVGIAVDRGLFTLDGTLGELLPPTLATLDAGKQAITVRNLLTMSSGFSWSEAGALGYNDWITAPDQIRYLTDRALVATPGSTFAYNSAAVHLLSVILATKSGMTTPQFADRYLFGPLGIARREWEPVSGGFVNGGAGLDLRARDLARLGVLMLQDGVSGDTRVLPAGWMVEATRSRYGWSGTVGPLRDTNYGYLTWIERAGPHPAFFAWGYGGQFIYVVPSLDMVVVATTNWSGLGTGVSAQEAAVLDIIVNGVLGSA